MWFSRFCGVDRSGRALDVVFGSVGVAMGLRMLRRATDASG